MLLPTPEYFTLEVRDFNYDPASPEPVRFLAFLNELFPVDAGEIALLQEVFGYLLTLDVSLQKIFLLLGPPRAGKGTLLIVLEALVGADNVFTSNLAALGQNFGLAPFIGKSLVVFPDARLSGRTDGARMVERLVSISGADKQSIDLKYRDPWYGNLTARLLILTNELMALRDESGALASRFIPIVLKETFLGRENTGLAAELVEERQAIFHWALRGLTRLRQRLAARDGDFVLPDSSREVRAQLRGMTAPFSSFAEECLVFEPEARVTRPDLFLAYQAWCVRHGWYPVPNSSEMGKALRAYAPKVGDTQPHGEANRVRWYTGVGLRDPSPV